VAAGSRNAAHLQSDPDLHSLHDLDGFQAIAAGIEGGAAAAPTPPRKPPGR
jgi:hypothetical protein